VTAVAVARARPAPRWWPRRGTAAAAPTVVAGPLPPISPRLAVLRGALLMVLVLSISMLVYLLVLSSLQQHAAQDQQFDALRGRLALGTAPIGPTDSEGFALERGTPIAYLEIPEIGLRQVVTYGTTPGTLTTGPGLRRDTPFPGQVGTSVVFGRRTAFGGPFGQISGLEAGDLVRVTTGQGEFAYEVVGVRREGDPVPAPVAAGSARIVLTTADGRPLLPDGVVRVDADLVGPAVGGAAPAIATSALPSSEQALGTDTSTLWALLLWLQALIALSVVAVWSWYRWGRAQTWIVFVPVLLLVGMATAGQAARLLPNLL
jgi:sortase A